MSSNYIIELNQNDPRANVKQNGEYSVNITEKTILNDGDSILLNKVFVDTVAQAEDKIKIEDDLPIEISFSKWVWYIDTVHKQLKQVLGGTTTDLTGKTASPCLVCSLQSSGNSDQIDNVHFEPVKNGQPYGGQTVTFNYIDPQDNKRTGHIDLAEVPPTFPDFDQPVLLQTILIKPGTTPTIVDEGDFKKAANISLIRFDTRNVTVPSYTPINYKASFTIPKGDYDPTELGSIISEGFTQAFNTTQEIQLVDPADPLAPTKNELFKPLEQRDILLPTKETQIFFGAGTDPTGYYYAEVTADDGIYGGTNQFAFEWLQDFNKFAFNTIHTPLTDDEGSISFKAYQSQGITSVPTGAVSIVSAYSGICFNSLEPVSFWQDKLGFKVADLCSWQGDFYTVEGTNLIDWQYNPSKFTTTGQVLLSGLSGNGNDVGTVQTGTQFLTKYVTISNSNQIVARDQILNAAGAPATSYFLIEINSKFSNTFLSSYENNRNIQAIVSTYYSTASSTIGTSSDGIVYTHKGSPIELSGFDVRILNQDKVVASDIINDNNVIFLQVVRAPSPTQDNMLLKQLEHNEKKNKK